MTKHPISTRQGLLAVLAALLLGALLVGAPGSADAATGTTGTPPGKAWIRVGHFVPGMGATTISLKPLSGAAQPIMMARGATYGDITAYSKVAPGSYTAIVRESSASSGSAPLLSRSFTVGAGQARTLAVLGTAAQPRLALLTDDLTPPRPGTARVRLLSASDTAQSVSVRAVNGPLIAEDTVLGETSGYATVPAGGWTLDLQSASAGPMSQVVKLSSGSVYTVVALDSGSGVKLEAITDAAGAMMTPKGAAHTGLGGMAPHQDTVASSSYDEGELALAALVGVLLTGAALLVPAARRRVTVRGDR